MSIILRMRDVVNATGLSRSTIYHMIKTNEFPRPIRLGQRAVGWLQSDITSWLDQRPTMTNYKHRPCEQICCPQCLKEYDFSTVEPCYTHQI